MQALNKNTASKGVPNFKCHRQCHSKPVCDHGTVCMVSKELDPLRLFSAPVAVECLRLQENTPFPRIWN